MVGDKKKKGWSSAAEQIGNDFIIVKKSRWAFSAFVALASWGAVSLQIWGIGLENGWQPFYELTSGKFDPVLWFKSAAIALAGLVAFLSTAKASMEIRATYSHTTNVTNQNHYSDATATMGNEKLEAALGRLPSEVSQAVRDFLMEFFSQSKLERVEVDKADFSSLREQADLVKELTAAGALQKISSLEVEVENLRTRHSAEVEALNREKIDTEALAEIRQQDLQRLESLKLKLETERDMLAVAQAALSADNDNLKKELVRARHVLGIGEDVVRDWAGVADKTAQFADAVNRLKSGT
jgi:hypothetical protein